MSQSQIVEMALENIGSLRTISGDNNASPEKQAHAGRERALKILTLTNIEAAKCMAEEVPDMLIALLVLVGAEYFDIDQHVRTRVALVQETGRKEIAWEEIGGHVHFIPPVGEWIKSMDSADTWAALVEVIDSDRGMRYLLSTVKVTPAAVQTKHRLPAVRHTATKGALVQSAAKKLADPQVTPAASAKALMRISAGSSALVLASSFNSQLELATPKDRDAVAERAGHKLELVLDELPDNKAAKIVGEMIKAGDAEVLISMVKANAGSDSSVARHLTADLVAEMFERDPDLHDEKTYINRLVYVMYTLLVESSADRDSGIVEYFESDRGQRYISELAWLAETGDENAMVAMRYAYDELGIVNVDLLDPNDNFTKDEDEDNEESAEADLIDFLRTTLDGDEFEPDSNEVAEAEEAG